jgi:hypothetical protein
MLNTGSALIVYEARPSVHSIIVPKTVCCPNFRNHVTFLDKLHCCFNINNKLSNDDCGSAHLVTPFNLSIITSLGP